MRCPFQLRKVATMPISGTPAGSPSERRASSRSAGREARRIDAGRNRADVRRRDADVADQLRAYRFAGGDDLGGRLGVQPARHRIARHRRGDVPGPHQRRRPRQRATGERGEPGIGRAVRVDRVDSGARRESDAARATPRGRLRPIGSAVTGTPKRGASAKIRASRGQASSTRWPRAIIPAASVRMRISWPPQPSEASV